MRKTRRIKLFLFGIALSFLPSCMDYYCDPIVEAIRKNCSVSGGSCVIDLKKVYPMKWDHMYIFDSMMHPSEISETIGFDCDCAIVEEGKRLILFTRKDEIIKSTLTECFVISFGQLRENGVVKINSEESVFKVKIKSVNNLDHYYLSKK